MKKILNIIIVLLFIAGIFLNPFIADAQNNSSDSVVIDFFYSSTCPHCAKENKFLDKIENKYPQAEINRYSIGDSSSRELLFDLVKKHNAERYYGSVPMTFIGSDFYLGFDNEEGIGKKIEQSIKKQIDTQEDSKNNTTSTNAGGNKISVPLAGEISPDNYSLPALSVILGLLDGFNVCSLGALVLILGLVIALRSRKKILTLGGLFILTTAIIYGLLIVLWYQLFSALSSYIGVMEILVGLIGLGGGLFFLNEFRKYRKYGPQCETAGGKIVSKLSKKVEDSFRSKKSLFALMGIIFIFAAVITIVEFPCSAAVPVVFAGILAEQGLSSISYISLIALFVLFYMLDELIIFLIAVWKMDVWMASPKFVTWAALIEGLILIALGLYYLVGIV